MHSWPSKIHSPPSNCTLPLKISIQLCEHPVKDQQNFIIMYRKEIQISSHSKLSSTTVQLFYMLCWNTFTFSFWCLKYIRVFFFLIGIVVCLCLNCNTATHAALFAVMLISPASTWMTLIHSSNLISNFISLGISSQTSMIFQSFFFLFCFELVVMALINFVFMCISLFACLSANL